MTDSQEKEMEGLFEDQDRRIDTHANNNENNNIESKNKKKNA